MNTLSEPVESSTSSAIAFNELSHALAGKLGEGEKESLVISTHPFIECVCDGMLSKSGFPDEHRTRIIDTPQEVLKQIDRLAEGNRERFGCVLAAFQIHHFRGQELVDCIAMLKKISNAVLLGDYAFLGHDADEIRQYVNTDAERKQQEIYKGFEPWLASHAVFTQATFFDAVAAAEPKSGRGFVLPGRKVGAVISDTLSDADVGDIVVSIEKSDDATDRFKKKKRSITWEGLMKLMSGK
jgi:hypothetical protein